MVAFWHCKVAGPTSSFGGVDGSIERARWLSGPSSTGCCGDHCSISTFEKAVSLCLTKLANERVSTLTCHMLSTLIHEIVIEELERQSIRQNASFFSFSTTSFVRYCSQHPLPKGNAEDILKLFCTSVGSPVPCPQAIQTRDCPTYWYILLARQSRMLPVSCGILGDVYILFFMHLTVHLYPKLLGRSDRQTNRMSAAFRFEYLNFSPHGILKNPTEYRFRGLLTAAYSQVVSSTKNHSSQVVKLWEIQLCCAKMIPKQQLW